MPFPYVTADELQRELPYSHETSGLTESEWMALLTDKLKQESERVDQWTNESYRGDSATVPFIVRAAVIRLTRSVITQIESDGLSSEKVDDHSESYRPPSEIREEVRKELGEAGYTDDAVFQLDAMGK